MFAIPGVITLSIAASRMHHCVVDFVHGPAELYGILPFLFSSAHHGNMVDVTVHRMPPRKWTSGREDCTNHRDCTTGFARPDGSIRALGLSAVFDLRDEPSWPTHRRRQTDVPRTDGI
jgi:hypothetical protein